MNKYVYLILLGFLWACSKDEPAPPTVTDGSVVEVSDAEETAVEELVAAEFVTQEEFDNLVKGHLWACYQKVYGGGIPFNSAGEEISTDDLAGDWDGFRGFKIENGKVYDYRRAAAPGFYIKPEFQVVTTDEYQYNPLTGELTYDVPGIVEGVEHRRLVLTELSDGSLIIRHRFGSFYKDAPTVINKVRSSVQNEIDEGSHYRLKLLLFSGEEEAEYVKDFVLMN